MPAGRPSKLPELDMNQVRILAGMGFTDQQFAEFFGISRSTWSKWKKENPGFSDSLKGWKAEADAKVERSLFERATGYSHPEDKIFNNNGVALVVPTIKHYPPDPTSCIFWLKNRQPERWRDNPNSEAGDAEIRKLLAAAAKVMEENV